MPFTADQYSHIATEFQKAAAHPSLTPEHREEFAQKAEWFRFLSERLKAARRPGSTFSGGENRSESGFSLKPPPSEPPKRSLRPILTTFWVTGAAIYLIGTFWATNNVFDLFRQELEKKPSTAASRSVSSPRVIASSQETGRGQPAVPPSSTARHRRHAISPDEPRYEPPIVPLATPEQGQIASAPSPAPTASSPSLETASEIQATATATARNGPSTDAKVIGNATLMPAPSEDGSNVADTRAQKATSAARSKLVTKKVRKKPSGLAQVARQRPSRPSPPARDRAYADLPADEELLGETPPRRGFFARRRMLREGLMSSGFIPLR
jgi:hypothetical protein